MSCPSSADIRLTDSAGTTHDLICDWSKGGAGIKIEKPDNIGGTAVSTKGNYGVRDSNDYMRIIQTDWVEGCAQETYDLDTDSTAMFKDSRHIDVGTKGEFKLGPSMNKKTDATQLPCIINHGTSANAQTLWASFTDESTATNRLAYSTDGDTWTKIATAGPPGSPTSFATDGELLYMIANGKAYSLATGASGVTAVSDESNLTHIAFASGQLYASKGTAANDARLGFFSAATGATWTALTPAITSAINAAGVTFGLVAKDSSVYWGVTNGSLTKVYKAQYIDGSSDTLVPVATFPTGFIGACMYQYLGTIYVGGHFDGETTSTGIGTIYGISDNTPFLLTSVGTDPTKDNKVLSMSAYARNLYFIANSHIWRWDLVNGGYSHWAGPLDSTPTLSYSAIDWDGTWTCNVAPGTGTEPKATVETGGGSSAALIKDAKYIEVQLLDTGKLWRRYTTTDKIDGIDDTVGTTVELVPYILSPWVSENWLYCSGTYQHPIGCVIALRGSAVAGLVEIEKVGFDTDATVSIKDGIYRGTSTRVSSGTVSMDKLTKMVFRVTLKDTTMKVYFNSALVCSGKLTTVPDDPKKVFVQMYADDAKAADSYVAIDQIRWTSSGAYSSGESNETAVTGAELACWKDKVAAACSGKGITYTSTTEYKSTDVDGEEAPPYLLSSRSSGNMPTVDKYISSINLTFANIVPDTSYVTVSGIIDGVTFTTSKDDARSTSKMYVFPVETIGRNIQYQVNITAPTQGSPGTPYTPVINEAAVLFLPTPKQTRLYTYYFRVWDNVEDNSGGTWSEDAETVCDFIEEIANTIVTVERNSGDSYSGKVEELEFIEAPPTSIPSGRQGLYRLDIRRMS